MKRKVTAENRIVRSLRILAALVIITMMSAAVFVLAEETAYAAEGYEDVAEASETAGSKSVVKYGMTPIYARDIKPGKYIAKTETSSSFFRIAETKLTVRKKKMTAVLEMGSQSYKCVYVGTGKEAAKADKKDYIMAEESDYGNSFTIPVEALDKEIELAAFSKRKKKWYDRKILIDASSLPESAVKFELPDYDRIESAIELYDKENGTDTESNADADSNGEAGMGEGGDSGRKDVAEKSNQVNAPEGTTGDTSPVDIDMKDGTYSIEVVLTGGSGRASVSSPTWFIVKNGKAYARLLWSSSYYDYMMVGGKKYLNESTDGGNSSFTIPVRAFDTPVQVVADTTAMGDPVAVDYQLTFYKDSIDTRNKIPQEAAKGVLVIAGIVIVLGGILNLILKRHYDRKR